MRLRDKAALAAMVVVVTSTSAQAQFVYNQTRPGNSATDPSLWYTELEGPNAGRPQFMFFTQDLVVDPSTYSSSSSSPTPLQISDGFRGMAADNPGRKLYGLDTTSSVYGPFANNSTSGNLFGGTGLVSIDYGFTPGDASSAQVEFKGITYIDFDRPQYAGVSSRPGGPNSSSSQTSAQQYQFFSGLAYDQAGSQMYGTLSSGSVYRNPDDRASSDGYLHTEGLYRIDTTTAEATPVFYYEGTGFSSNIFTGETELSPTNNWSISAIDYDNTTGRLFGVSNEQPSSDPNDPRSVDIVELNLTTNTIEVLATLPSRTDDFQTRTILYPGLAASDGKLYLTRAQQNVDAPLTNPDLPLSGFPDLTPDASGQPANYPSPGSSFPEAEHLVYDYLTGTFLDALQSPFPFQGTFVGDSELIASGSGAWAPNLLLNFLLGDMNGDGSVNNLDINPFVLAITNLEGYEAAFPGLDGEARGDINQDSAFNNLDIIPFVGLLTGGASASAAQLSLFADAGFNAFQLSLVSSVPEPASGLLLLAGVGLLMSRHRRSVA